MPRFGSHRRRGNALIEFMFMLPFYATMLFGAMEFTQIFYDRLQLNNASREGVRRAALGKTLAQVRSTMRTEASGMSLTDAMLTIEYNNASDGTGSWVAASDSADGTTNAIPLGYLCRVKITNWPHTLKTGTYFSNWPGVSGTSFSMSAMDVMMRQ